MSRQLLNSLNSAALGKDGAAVMLTAAPFAVLGNVPAAVWLGLISLLVTAYFRRQEIRLRREELRRRDRRDEEMARLQARVDELTAGRAENGEGARRHV